jgi:hypothetical protein
VKKLQGKTIKEQLIYTYEDISMSINHGECFYEKKELDDFINSLELLKILAIQYFQENTEEDF